MAQRRQFPGALKAKVAIEALKGILSTKSTLTFCAGCDRRESQPDMVC